MMNRNLPWLTCGLAIVGCLSLSLALVACSPQADEETTARDTAPPPPPPPPEPTVTPVEELKDRLRIDERVRMNEDVAPRDDAERQALLEFFDAVARGDHRTLREMLSDSDREQLDRMVESGRWEQATSDIREIDIHQIGSADNLSLDFDMSSMVGTGMGMEQMGAMFSDTAIEEVEQQVQSGEFREMASQFMPESQIEEFEAMIESGEFRQQMQQAAHAMEDLKSAMQIGDRCVLALILSGSDYQTQAQLWRFNITDDGARFDAVATPHNVVGQLSGTDWIASWHEIVLQELAMAELPDDLTETRPQIVLDDDDAEEGRSPGDRPGDDPTPPPPTPPTVPIQPGGL